MTNNHNYNDDLDNEVMPQIGFDDDFDHSFRTGKLYTNGDSQSMKNIDNNVVKKPESKSNTVRTTKSNSGTMNGITNGNKNGNVSTYY